MRPAAAPPSRARRRPSPRRGAHGGQAQAAAVLFGPGVRAEEDAQSSTVEEAIVCLRLT
jgi:hypothetical protein